MLLTLTKQKCYYRWQRLWDRREGRAEEGRGYHCKQESQKTISIVEEIRNASLGLKNGDLNFWDGYKFLVKESQVLSKKCKYRYNISILLRDLNMSGKK